MCARADSGKVCQFPFIINGKVKWDCVEVGAENSWNGTAQACNVKEFKEIQEFEDLSEFQECGECSPSVKDGSFHFERFRLANHGNYSRVDSKEDCQTLCDLAEGCNFFVYEQTHVKCFLKYGVGKKSQQSRNIL